ncbi:MAG: NADP-dependent oxidoreductase [Bryobacteraceae bacterium]|nr:NADP-dependent oxidoreductase [Bryobacteraceae bacterium]
MQSANKQVLLAERPTGFPEESNFRLVETAMPRPGEGEFLVAIAYLSVDPYMRGRMNEARSYADPVKIGEVMTGGAVGRIVESRHAKFQAGDYVVGPFGWQQYAISDGVGVRRVDPAVAPISTSLGVLGMPGLTAYFGLLDICRPKQGETVVVSGAAGAVGSYVGQIARIKGCRVAGVAGSDEKLAWITSELGFEVGMNYRTCEDYRTRLKQMCPDGVDVYFDNVGGSITDAMFPLLNPRARVAICGQIALYNLDKPDPGPRLLPIVLVRQVKVEGFLVFQFADRYREALTQLTEWVRSGALKYREDIAEGIENAPAAFIGMLKGRNIGKQLVKISDV